MENQPLPQDESTKIQIYKPTEKSKPEIENFQPEIENFQPEIEIVQPKTSIDHSQPKIDFFRPKTSEISAENSDLSGSPKVEIFEPIIEDEFIVVDTRETTKTKAVNPLTEEAKYFLDLEAGEDNSGDLFDNSYHENDADQLLSNEKQNFKSPQEKSSRNIEKFIDELKSENSENEATITYDDFEEENLIHSQKSSQKTIKISFDDIKSAYEKRKEKSKNFDGRHFFAKMDESKSAEEELTRKFTKNSFKDLEIIGQFNKGFIIGKLGQDLFLIDQHASDEKFNFEKLMSKKMGRQKMVCSKRLKLNPGENQILSEKREIFEKIGFEFDFRDEDVFLVSD